MRNRKLLLQFLLIVTYIHISLSGVETCLIPAIHTPTFHSRKGIGHPEDCFSLKGKEEKKKKKRKKETQHK